MNAHQRALARVLAGDVVKAIAQSLIDEVNSDTPYVMSVSHRLQVAIDKYNKLAPKEVNQ